MSETLQNILIILLPMWALIDNRGVTIVNHWPITVGFFAGLIMGDMKSAMEIAGTFQLMSLGVAALGGSSVPDYALATVVSIFLNARTDADIGASMAVGLPVGMLAMNLDVLTHTLNSFVANKSKEYLEAGEFSKSKNVNWLSIFMVAMQGFIPMVLLVAVGPTAVNAVIDFVPDWILNGLNIAGGMLPVVGVAMLMRSMPAGKYIWAILIGFVLSAYLELPILGISIIGLAMAVVEYHKIEERRKSTAVVDNVVDEGIDFDE